VILKVESAREEPGSHSESTEQGQILLAFGTVFPVHDISQVATERTCNEIEKSASIIEACQRWLSNHGLIMNEQDRRIISRSILIEPTNSLAEQSEQDILHLCVERQFLHRHQRSSSNGSSRTHESKGSQIRQCGKPSQRARQQRHSARPCQRLVHGDIQHRLDFNGVH
jgi:hypothetical protein